MSWFDGTFDTALKKIEEVFPVKVCDSLRTNEDESKIAIINSFKEDSTEYVLADPHMELEYFEQEPFYHLFTGDDATPVREMITRFVEAGHGTNEGEIKLIRNDGEKLYHYANGEICIELLCNNEALRGKIPDALQNTTLFVLPLKVYRYPCPVCGTRCYEWPGMFEICPECGWEDDCFVYDEDDTGFGANGGWTIRKHRERYLAIKKSYPEFRWWKWAETNEPSIPDPFGSDEADEMFGKIELEED